MPTVGTAGHVDHGKSALIEALCGTNPMHLPEEFRREMTIDLGFSFFPDDSGNPVGVIDVPGHERFIRNMTAGMSGLDLVLLVVAADEGWMSLTTEHLQIIHCLRLESLILVVNKIDKVPPGRADSVGKDARARISRKLGTSVPVCGVSALNGTGIENLRAMILRELEPPSPPASGKAPFFFVDRVFTLTGKGTVAAGTLQNGPLHLNQPLKLSSTGELVRIKGMQVCRKEVRSADASSRVACNIKIPGKTAVQRGDCLFAPEASITVGRNLLLQLDTESGMDLRLLKNHGETDLAIGTLHAVGKIHVLNEQRTAVQMILNRPIPFFFGMRGVLFQPGNSVLLCGFRVLACCETNRKKKREIVNLLETRNFSSGEEFRLFTEGISAERKAECRETDDSLHPLGSRLLNLASKGGRSGLNPKEVCVPGVSRELANLCRMKKLVRLDENLYYERGTFDEICALIERCFDSGELFSIAQARSITHLSRKYLLPVLNVMELENRVFREGNFRRVTSN